MNSVIVATFVHLDCLLLCAFCRFRSMYSFGLYWVVVIVGMTLLDILSCHVFSETFCS